MSRKRQNNQRKLAFATEGSGEARADRGTGIELLAAERGTESPAKMTAKPLRTAVYVTRTYGGVGGAEE